jgi:hypothetical protein
MASVSQRKWKIGNAACPISIPPLFSCPSRPSVNPVPVCLVSPSHPCSSFESGLQPTPGDLLYALFAPFRGHSSSRWQVSAPAHSTKFELIRVKRDIEKFLMRSFPCVFAGDANAPRPKLRMGFDVAASGQGDLAAFYIDDVRGSTLQLAGLLTCRTRTGTSWSPCCLRS